MVFAFRAPPVFEALTRTMHPSLFLYPGDSQYTWHGAGGHVSRRHAHDPHSLHFYYLLEKGDASAMCRRDALILLLLLPVFALGCTSNTNWEPIADRICTKYAERVTLMQQVQGKADGARVLPESDRWQAEYEKLTDELSNAILALRGNGGALDIAKFDALKKRWSEIDASVKEEMLRLNRMNGVGPDHDANLGKITRTNFTNPFR